MRNIFFFLLSSALVLSIGCITKVEERDSASSHTNTFTITASADSGATISPSSTPANAGDRPKFIISLKSGYRIDTVLCWVGGALTRNDNGTYTFTMAPVERSETVTVRTIRSSGIAILQDESRFEAVPLEHGALQFIGTGTVLDRAEIQTLPLYEEGNLVFVYRVRFPSTAITVNDPSVSVSTHEVLGVTEMMLSPRRVNPIDVSVLVDGKKESFSLKFLSE